MYGYLHGHINICHKYVYLYTYKDMCAYPCLPMYIYKCVHSQTHICIHACA